MKWLTLTLIKQQLRLEQDYHDEDALLELYGGSAENTILQCTNRTVDELKAMNPAGADTFDLKIKNYVRLADRKEVTA